MPVQQAYRPNETDVMPALKMYLDSLEAWKRSYEEFAGKMSNMSSANTNGQSSIPKMPESTSYDASMQAWQKSGQEFFKRFVEQQVEICHFLGARWEKYLKLPEQLAKCRSPADYGQVQAAFFSQFADDYMHETKKLAQPAGQNASNWTAGYQA